VGLTVRTDTAEPCHPRNCTSPSAWEHRPSESKACCLLPRLPNLRLFTSPRTG